MFESKTQNTLRKRVLIFSAYNSYLLRLQSIVLTTLEFSKLVHIMFHDFSARPLMLIGPCDLNVISV